MEAEVNALEAIAPAVLWNAIWPHGVNGGCFHQRERERGQSLGLYRKRPH